MKYKLQRNESFNHSRAEMDVWYTLWREETTLFRKRKVWRVIQTGYMDSRFPIRGDLDWAKKIAKHYGIEVPEK